MLASFRTAVRPASARIPTRSSPKVASVVYQRAMATLFEAIKDDHEEMYEYHDQYKQARDRGDVEAQARWVRQLTWEIARHAVGEEIVVYPLMEKHLGEKGKQLADHDRKEHLNVKQHLYKLESLHAGSNEYHNVIAAMMESLHHHNDDEEIKDLPPLESEIGRESSKEAAKSFKKTKKLVPTRAHPSVPNKPPVETLLGLLEAPIDKLKDWFATFPTEDEMSEAKEELKHRDHDAAATRSSVAR